MNGIEAIEVYKKIKFDLIMLLAFYLFISAAIDALPVWRGSTDGKKRSGMMLHVDAMTGCQYLSTRGGMVQRVDANGKHICTGE